MTTQMSGRRSTPNETQDQRPLARAARGCWLNVKVTLSGNAERPGVSCIAWLGLFVPFTVPPDAQTKHEQCNSERDR
jgi:hypothetical protein